eukprot:1185796-Prorocentrum_minimum.AAC.1
MDASRMAPRSNRYGGVARVCRRPHIGLGGPLDEGVRRGSGGGLEGVWRGSGGDLSIKPRRP